MTFENAINFAIKVLEWGLTQTPDILSARTKETILKLKNREMLDSPGRKLVGLTLFTYSMHNGPSTFTDVEDAALELGVGIELKAYAVNFKEHAEVHRFDKIFTTILDELKSRISERSGL